MDPARSIQSPDVQSVVHAAEAGPPPASEPVRRPALRAVYEAHFGYVWHSLRRLGVPHRDLEDLVHEVFVVVHGRLGAYDPNRPLKPWLFGIAFRVASEFLRRAGHRRELLDAGPDLPDAAPLADLRLEAAEARCLVLEALEAVEVGRRAVFVMHELQDHPIPQVAEALQINVNTAYSRLRLARADFADAVRRIRHRRASGHAAPCAPRRGSR